MKKLIVLVPGIRGDASKYNDLIKFISTKPGFEDAIWMHFNYKGPVWDNQDPKKIALDLGALINQKYEQLRHDGIEIYLIGHSMGSAILRRAFMDAMGQGASESLAREWPAHVSRIILLAAISRGVDFGRYNFWTNKLYSVAFSIFSFFGLAKKVKSVLSGSDFLTKLRIDWIRYNSLDISKPMLIHLLGNYDKTVKEEDVVDLEQFSSAINRWVPKTSHNDVNQVTENTKHELELAFCGKPENQRVLNDIGQHDKVYFLLHGIRDSSKTFKAIKKGIEDGGGNCKVIVPNYGFLSARQFIYSRYRDSFIPWFTDQYSQALAENPNAKFYFGGHSNGTYILGESLKRVSNIRFERLYLAGTVLPQKFNWSAIVRGNQVEKIRSDMGSEDWPVGILCRTLKRFGWKKIGTAGTDGFEWNDNQHIALNDFEGGHGDMLIGSNNVDSIVNFLLNGSSFDVDNGKISEPPAWYNLGKKYFDVALPVVFIGLTFLVYHFYSIYSLLAYIFLLIVIWIFLGRH